MQGLVYDKSCLVLSFKSNAQLEDTAVDISETQVLRMQRPIVDQGADQVCPRLESVCDEMIRKVLFLSDRARHLVCDAQMHSLLGQWVRPESTSGSLKVRSWTNTNS